MCEWCSNSVSSYLTLRLQQSILFPPASQPANHVSRKSDYTFIFHLLDTFTVLFLRLFGCSFHQNCNQMSVILLTIHHSDDAMMDLTCFFFNSYRIDSFQQDNLHIRCTGSSDLSQFEVNLFGVFNTKNYHFDLLTLPQHSSTHTCATKDWAKRDAHELERNILVCCYYKNSHFVIDVIAFCEPKASN